MEFWDLGFSNEETKEFNDDVIGNRKLISRFMAQARKDAKIDRCYYCGRETTELCNSHYIPKFCLNNISDNGDVYDLNSLIDFPLIEKEKGVKEAGVFRLICRQCDSTIFSDYENPDSYTMVPTSKMIAQIALKNYLRYISKRRMEIAIYNRSSEISEFGKFMSDSMSDVNLLDLADFHSGFETAKRLSVKKNNDNYYIFFHKILDYVVPISVQSLMILICDLDGNVLNNIYCNDEDYHMKAIHVCIFPLKSTSVLLMFGENSNKLYRKFYKQFNSLGKREQLSVLNYMVFIYTEDVFLSKFLPDTVMKDHRLINAAKQTTRAFYSHPSIDPILEAVKRFDLRRWNSIPNLLDEGYKLR